MRRDDQMQGCWLSLVGLVSNLTKTILLSSLLGVLGSCGKKVDSDLIIKLSPPDSPVLQMDAYSCGQRIDGITDTTTGNPVTPKYKGPVVIFNRLTMEWKKTTKLFVTQAKIKFVGSGIQGGEEICELSSSLFDFFERETSAATQTPTGIYSADTFLGKGVVTTNPKCRVVCPITLTDPERPEISASAELSVRAVELTNEGKEDEKYFRVKSSFRARIVP